MDSSHQILLLKMFEEVARARNEEIVSEWEIESIQCGCSQF
jgi:hypothetical protein